MGRRRSFWRSRQSLFPALHASRASYGGVSDALVSTTTISATNPARFPPKKTTQAPPTLAASSSSTSTFQPTTPSSRQRCGAGESGMACACQSACKQPCSPMQHASDWQQPAIPSAPTCGCMRPPTLTQRAAFVSSPPPEKTSTPPPPSSPPDLLPDPHLPLQHQQQRRHLPRHPQGPVEPRADRVQGAAVHRLAAHRRQPQ
jgi:hypothetical protein